MALAAVAFRSFSGDPVSQVLSLLQIMDSCGGKAKVNAMRSGTVVGMFNLMPLPLTSDADGAGK
jgi:hypothetical protein